MSPSQLNSAQPNIGDIASGVIVPSALPHATKDPDPHVFPTEHVAPRLPVRGVGSGRRLPVAVAHESFVEEARTSRTSLTYRLP